MAYTPQDETAIAYWTRPQYIDVSNKTKIGVAAYALEGIEKVEWVELIEAKKRVGYENLEKVLIECEIKLNSKA